MIVEPAASTTSLEHRMRLEQFLAECAARFTAPQLSAADRAIEAVLGELLALAGADRCALVGGTPAGRLSWITCAAYGDPDVPSFGDMNFAVVFPWHFEQVLERGQAQLLEPEPLVLRPRTTCAAETRPLPLGERGLEVLRGPLELVAGGGRSAVGGLMVPSFAMDTSLKTISNLSPMHWCLQAYYGLFLEGGKLADVMGYLIPLVLITLVLQLITFLGLKRKNLI